MSVATSTKPYDHTSTSGDRGVILTATRPYAPGLALSADFPDVFISDRDEVELGVEGGGSYPADDMLEWLEAVAAAIRKHTGRPA